jgi:hypothetical protein
LPLKEKKGALYKGYKVNTLMHKDGKAERYGNPNGVSRIIVG